MVGSGPQDDGACDGGRLPCNLRERAAKDEEHLCMVDSDDGGTSPLPLLDGPVVMTADVENRGMYTQ